MQPPFGAREIWVIALIVTERTAAHDPDWLARDNRRDRAQHIRFRQKEMDGIETPFTQMDRKCKRGAHRMNKTAGCPHHT